MANFTKTASAKTAIAAVSQIHTAEAFSHALARGLERVWKRVFELPLQGLRYIREDSTRQETATFATYRSISGLIPQNRDADDLPYTSTADGFTSSLQTYTYRKAIGFEKTLTEVDDVGVARGRQTELVSKCRLTLEYIIADLFNRCLGTAPILMDDGMYLIDSARPNANPEASTWSNLESTAAISETSIFTAALAARQQKGEDGETYPTEIKKIIIRPNEEKTVWTLLNTPGKVGSQLNDRNFFMGKYEFEIYDWMTTAQILYLLTDAKSEENELAWYWRVRPELETWKSGDNPDITNQRVRFAGGLWGGSPRKAWRGGAIS